MKPQSFGELFKFYYDVVKLLYSAVQANNSMPQETLFEINAAFDHLSRRWTEGEDEAFVSEKVYSHLKRGCLDIFKILYRDTIDEHKRLLEIDTSIIDNGRFDAEMLQLISQIKQGARDARRGEGRRSDNDVDEAFGKWSEVFEKCEALRREYFLNPNVDWARRKTRMYSVKTFVFSVIASLIAGIALSPLVLGLLQQLWALLYSGIK